MTKIRTEEEEQEILERKSKMTSKTQNICANCGHERKEHLINYHHPCWKNGVIKNKCLYKSHDFSFSSDCPCRKFQPVGRKK